MHRPLRIIDILTYAAETHPDQGIVSVRTEGDLHRCTYPEALARVAQLSHAIKGLGVQIGDRVATLAWNGYRHFELYYAVSGMGAVCHTINPRLAAEQLSYIINHAEDRLLFIDTSFVPIVEAIRDTLPRDMRYVILTDRAHMPDTKLDALCYEELLAPQPQTIDWPEFSEDTAAALCYTSGTTGNPKGALFSHRSTLLHTLMLPVMQRRSFRPGRKVLPIVPLFHVNAWGLPYTAPLAGMTMVMPGAHLDGPSLFRLLDEEQVFSAWGVPTVWAALLNEINAQSRPPKGFTDLVVGGSAAPSSMIEAYEAHGIVVSQAWGMTEMSPVGTNGTPPDHLIDAPTDQRIKAQSNAGRRNFGIDFKIIDDNETHLPHDGTATGELYVRGNTIISGYYKNEAATKAAFDKGGWFATGDIASIDATGRLTIHDRAKDLIKSGGEWISSIDLENAAISHPGIATCAVIAIKHPKWDERPILVAVAANQDAPTLQDLHAHMAPHFAKWQLPDDLIFVDDLPLTATGKVSKLTLRQQFADYILPDLRGV